MNLVLTFERLLGIPTTNDYTRAIVEKAECYLTLDVGCGTYSRLSQFRPHITTIGLDAFPKAIEEAKANDVHDQYIVANVLTEDVNELLANFGGQKFDLVTLYDVIEHLPKGLGYELLERCEELTSKYVLLQTPNGFLEQGPEFGNEHQRHLSGWFPHDFIGRGYKVYGAGGTKLLRGYAAGPRYDFHGWQICDLVLARLLRVHKRPKHAFNLVAIKDVRGIPARLG